MTGPSCVPLADRLSAYARARVVWSIRSLRPAPVACRLVPVLAVEVLVRPAVERTKHMWGCRLLCPSPRRRREVRKSAAYDHAMGLFRSAMRLFRGGGGEGGGKGGGQAPQGAT